MYYNVYCVHSQKYYGGTGIIYNKIKRLSMLTSIYSETHLNKQPGCTWTPQRTYSWIELEMRKLGTNEAKLKPPLGGTPPLQLKMNCVLIQLS